jgi:autotransporter-associated beta strand protein
MISSIGAWTKAGPGILSLGGTNTYTGATTVSAGVLRADSIGAFSAGSAFTIYTDAVLDLHGNSNAVGSLIGSGVVSNSGTEGPAPATLSVGADNTSTTFSGLLQDGASTLGLIKVGTGTLTLTGANTYSDGTTVGSGTLQLGNGGTTGSILGQNLSINPDGVITGAYFEPISGNPFGGSYRVFVRTPDGIFTTFDAATYPHCCTWSFPSGITPAKAITGSFNDGFAAKHGFLRESDGRVTSFDVPGAGTGFNQGTVPLGITPAGLIMGLYIDAKYRPHGFFFLPRRGLRAKNEAAPIHHR